MLPQPVNLGTVLEIRHEDGRVEKPTGATCFFHPGVEAIRLNESEGKVTVVLRDASNDMAVKE